MGETPAGVAVTYSTQNQFQVDELPAYNPLGNYITMGQNYTLTIELGKIFRRTSRSFGLRNPADSRDDAPSLASDVTVTSMAPELLQVVDNGDGTVTLVPPGTTPPARCAWSSGTGSVRPRPCSPYG